MASPRILIYSPDVAGHPRVYCRVIADALADQPCELILAMGFTDEIGFAQSADLHPLQGRERLKLVDTREHSRLGHPHLSAEELVALQHAFDIDTTLFIEADKSNEEFRRIAAGKAPRLRGRTLGIFANTAEWYPGEDSFTGERKTLHARTLRTTLGNIKRAIFNRRDTPKYFYEHIVIGQHVLDEILVKDERLAQWRGKPVSWMPEISRPVAAPESAEDSAEYARREMELASFLQVNAGREPVLYFGDAAYYKGYDLFLEFIAQAKHTCAIHAGRTYDATQRSYFRCDVEALRAQLRSEGRLLETNDYVHSERLKRLYFSSPCLYLTTHRLALSSSTVIQAIELGKPVLVPDRGLLGYRVRTHGLGGVYAYEDIPDLQRQADALWRTDLSRFAAATRNFWQSFSDEAVRSFFVRTLVEATPP